jgi:hypothetical protein
MRRREGLIALVLALSLGVSFLGGGGGPARAIASTAGGRPGGKPPHATTRPSEITLTPSVTGGPGVQVTMPPVGLSLEYPLMAQDLGSEACPPPALVAELRKLGSPPLALAGLSQDLTVPSGASSGPPSSWETGTLYSLPAGFWSQLHCLLAAAGDPLTAGLNMKTGAPSWASQIVAGAQGAATNGLDFSLGNEPDLYYLPNYASLDKPQGSEEATAVSLYLQLATSMQQAIGAVPLIGPELARPAHWQSELPRVIGQLHERTVGVHMYPLTACGSPRAVTLHGLLSTNAANAPRNLAWVVADASAAGAPAIISEANSASCGGEAGVSDQPAAAVWAVRFVLSALKTGFREVRFHFSGGPYDAFLVRGQEILARPLESALVALNQWLPAGSTLHTVAGVRGLVATGVGEPAGAGAAPGAGVAPSAAPGAGLLILDNERTQAQPVLLRGVHSVHIQALTATRAGLATFVLSASRGRIKFSVPGNSVLVVSSSA